MRSVSDARANGSESQPARASLRRRGGRGRACLCDAVLWTIACTAILGIRPVLAQQEPTSALIRQMSIAVRQSDYQGSFIYEHNGQIDALRLFHSGGTPERERLVSMSGARSEIVRDGGSFTCLQSGLPTVLFENRANARLLPLVPDAAGIEASGFYAASIAGSDRVAGYRARIIELSSRDGYRYGYRLWLDEGSHLLLRSALVDGGRRTVEQFMFVALDVGAKPKESDLQASGDSGIEAPAEEAPLPGPPQWRVADPPPGYKFVRAQRPAQGPTPAEHHLYSDGLADVSVYVEPRDPDVPTVADRSMARGGLHVYSRDVGGWRVTALGDVPRATVERMARSTQPVNADPR